jgi:hypothetical protein
LIGLNPETMGRINRGDRRLSLETYERFQDDNAAANDYLIELAIDRLKGKSISNLFRSKFILIWSSHDQLFQISLNGSNDQEIVEIMSRADAMINILITIFVGVHLIVSFITRPPAAVFTMQLFILGFAIWSLFLEAQNRYAIITIPFVILLASLGLNQLMSLVRRDKHITSM